MKAAGGGGGEESMASKKLGTIWFVVVLICLTAVSASAQSFRVQCPTSTITHPSALHSNDSEPAYTLPTTLATHVVNTVTGDGYQEPTANVNGAIKCQQISGGDGYATMGDGTQTYMFSFGPLSGLADIANGLPGTEFPGVFNTPYLPASATLPSYLRPGDPATSVTGTTSGPNASPISFAYNGAVGLALDIPNLVNIYDIQETGTTVSVFPNAPLGVAVGDSVTISGVGTGYDGTFPVTAIDVPQPTGSAFPQPGFQYTAATTGLGEVTASPTASASLGARFDGHVDPRPIIDVGTMNGNIPAPLFAIDEDDEFFLTLTNVGMIMRPDLFEQHTVHFHGYPNASAFYDGVPDASVAINIGGSFTYYYLAPDAGTYFWHCHITPPEHLQMGMVGQLYVRPRQNRVAVGSGLHQALVNQQADPRTSSNCAVDILCTSPVPPTDNGAIRAPAGNYAYNDGDGSTYYDVEYPIQMHGFDPNFHFVGMTFNPEGFTDMKDKYFMLNGRSYPDTVTPGPLATQSSDSVLHFSQPLASIINIPAGKKALLRISNLDVSEYQTLASMGIPMTVIAINAKILRDQAGNNLSYNTNSITLGGGESLDVILDATDTTKYPANSVFYLYTSNLDHLSNDAENFGGLMTEVRIN
jgi:FtsP/CotA-like multicopper oxidase with cupredoxin domain